MVRIASQLPLGLLSCAALLMINGVAFAQQSELKEYCQEETFIAECRANQAVVIDTAWYGRPVLGRCVRKDLGYLGCKVDVKRFLASNCSGKPRCEIKVFDSNLREFKPCDSGVTWHLLASYHCVTVQSGDTSMCSGGIDATGSTGLISSNVAETMRVGLSNCPWNIQSTEGKKIQLTAYNFLNRQVIKPESGHHIASEVCYKFAKVMEGNKQHTLTLCSDHGNETTVYTSDSNHIRVYFTQTTRQQSAFILRYSEIGCGSVPYVRDATITYSHDHQMATVRCNNTGETWYLNCEGTQWNGRLANNCTSQPIPSQVQGWSIFHTTTEFPYGLVLVVAIGVALGVFLGGSALVVVSYRMKRKYPRYEMPPELPSQDYLPDSMRTGHTDKTATIQPRQAQLQTYGGLQPCNQVIYDTAAINRRSTDSMQSGKTEIKNVPITPNTKTAGDKKHLYEMPQMI